MLYGLALSSCHVLTSASLPCNRARVQSHRQQKYSFWPQTFRAKSFWPQHKHILSTYVERWELLHAVLCACSYWQNEIACVHQASGVSVLLWRKHQDLSFCQPIAKPLAHHTRSALVAWLLDTWRIHACSWYVSNVSIIFDAPYLFLHHLLSVSLHFVALLCIFWN
jgi:hypothetical protein